ncbi:MAG: hypothetical protein K2P94_10535 [Rhodospirillaceae bacterium]|nr:hypothetical protein [Rhodospirillaceae bacterium]
MREILLVFPLTLCLSPATGDAQVDEATSKPVPPYTASYPDGVTSLRDAVFHT